MKKFPISATQERASGEPLFGNISGTGIGVLGRAKAGCKSQLFPLPLNPPPSLVDVVPKLKALERLLEAKERM